MKDIVTLPPPDDPVYSTVFQDTLLPLEGYYFFPPSDQVVVGKKKKFRYIFYGAVDYSEKEEQKLSEAEALIDSRGVRSTIDGPIFDKGNKLIFL